MRTCGFVSVRATASKTVGVGNGAWRYCLPAVAWILGATLAAQAETTLRSEAEKRGFLIGCASWESRTNGHEPAYTEILAREFNLVSTRAQLCTGAVQRTRGTFNFDEADKVFDFAREHKIKVYGHCLISSQDNLWCDGQTALARIETGRQGVARALRPPIWAQAGLLCPLGRIEEVG